METAILLWSLAGPGVVCICAAVLALWVARGQSGRGTSEDRWAGPLAAVLVVCGWMAAIAVPLIGRQKISWWPAEAWQQVVWPIGWVGVLLALCAPHHTARSGEEAARERSRGEPAGHGSPALAWLHRHQWFLGGVASLFVGMLAMPTGEGWGDLLPWHRGWLVAVVGCGLVNAWIMQQVALSGGERWVLWIALAGLGGPTILAATAYGGLAEWCLGAIAATLMLAIFALIVPRSVCWSALFPATFFAVAATASGRFYTYEDHPLWLYGLILLLPTGVSLVALLLGGRRLTIQVLASALTAAGLLAGIAYQLLLSGQE